MLLAISSASEACSAALLDGNTPVAEAHELIGRGHAERLVPMIADLIGGHIPTGILVDCGPGSFTGIRVGMAAASGLAIGWKVSVHGFSAMALLAARALADSQEPAVAVATLGGHGELFVQAFASGVTPLDEVRSLRADAAAAAFAQELVVGSGAEALVTARGWGQARPALPVASDVRLLPATLRNLPPRPIYVRAPDAKPLFSGR